MNDKNAHARDSAGAFKAAILLVDDNRASCSMISSLLQRVGVIGCEIALSGQEAIAKVAEQPYDIIFMDHLMPGMSGVETAMTLKAQYPANAPVIVAVTANPAWALGDTLFAAGMDDYLSKPLDAARLTQCLRKWLPANDTSETDSSSK